jgi:predicted nucleic acid-binding protein
VNAYLDTNVIIAGYVRSHNHHPQAVGLLRQVYDGKVSGILLAHGLSEMYSVLTRAPFVPRISSSEAWQLLNDRVLTNFEIVHLTTAEYGAAIRQCAHDGFSGGQIFDALHLQAARKAQCERIYTFNVRHFRQLAPDLADIIVAP